MSSLEMYQLLLEHWLYRALLQAIKCFKLLEELYREHIGTHIIHELTDPQHFSDY